MRTQVILLVGIGALVPIGIAVADYAGGDPERTVAPSDATGQLVALGERVVSGVAGARKQLSAALSSAERGEDVILASCLEAKLEEITELEGKAASQLDLLRTASGADNARMPYVVITVLGQKAGLVVEEAALCVGAEDDSAELGIQAIEPPVDPNVLQEGTPFDISEPSAQSGMPIALPPPAVPTTTTDPAMDIPMEMPPVPNTASPMR